MKQNEDNKFIPMTSVSGGKLRKVREDVFYYTTQIVNLLFLGKPQQGHWVLVDAGMPKAAKNIIAEAEEIYGANAKPAAIILTHGHFDHVGSLVELIERWQVPVYAHPHEFPYLTGQKSYPEPDTSVEGGVLAKISSIYPHQPVDISELLRPLPHDYSVPELPGWVWMHTPGHSPGHVSFFREKDKTLIAGDAFVTVKQDSLYKVLTQKKEVHGPPVYLTTDWQAAKMSVQKLYALNPDLVVTGHGSAMEGAELYDGLRKLAEEFDDVAIPSHGKFVNNNDGN